MASENTYDTTPAGTDAGGDEDGRLSGVVSTAQEAAERVRAVAGTAAERLPGAVANAQVAVDDTARVLNEMPNQALLAGTSFSLGLGVGLFLSGSNRVLVLLAVAPAAAMAATLMGRESATEA